MHSKGAAEGCRPSPSAIFLAGFMGAGKSTVGQALARALNWPFYDLDYTIEILANQEIPLIFEMRGEDVFREFEHAAVVQHVREALAGESMVVALGGGTYTFARNREKLRSAGITVWLAASPDTLWKRVRRDTHRPLAGDRETFYQLHAAREPSYALADARIDAAGAPDEVGNRIMRLRCLQGLRERD